MPDFPALSKKPDRNGFEEESIDRTIRSDVDAGYVFTRPRHRRQRTRYLVKYSLLTNADYLAIKNFVETVRDGSDIFDWTHPTTGVVKQVRFAQDGVPRYVYQGFDSGHLWAIEFTVEEA